jgi:tetratricopeptide (TPR) repeat protein
MTRALRPVAFGATVVVLVALYVFLAVERDRRYGDLAIEERLLYVPSGRLIEKLSLSYDAIAADAYWIRAIQHYGGDRLSDRARKFELLYPLLDITTTLDPLFTIAYRFGAIFLSEPYPGGAGRPDLAIKLLEKGIQAQPAKWQYYEDLGFVYYWQLRDYKAAADAFQRGADVPGSSWWMRSLAAVTFAQGGSRQAARFLWQQQLNETGNDWVRENAVMRLQQLDAMDQIDQLRALAAEYRRRSGRLPDSWSAMIGAGLLRGEPVDPSGVPYILNRSTGEVTLKPSSRLAPLPSEAPPDAPIGAPRS